MKPKAEKDWQQEQYEDLMRQARELFLKGDAKEAQIAYNVAQQFRQPK